MSQIFYTVRFADREFLSTLNVAKADLRSCRTTDEMKKFSTELGARKALARIVDNFPSEAKAEVVEVRIHSLGMAVTPLKKSIASVQGYTVQKAPKKKVLKGAQKPAAAPKKAAAPASPAAPAVDAYEGRWALDQYGFLSPKDGEVAVVTL